MTDQVPFRFRKAPEGDTCVYRFITNRPIDEDTLNRLREFWAERPELHDGQIVRV